MTASGIDATATSLLLLLPTSLLLVLAAEVSRGCWYYYTHSQSLPLSPCCLVCCHVAVSAIVQCLTLLQLTPFLVWVDRNMATTLLGVSVFVSTLVLFVLLGAVRSRVCMYVCVCET